MKKIILLIIIFFCLNEICKAQGPLTYVFNQRNDIYTKHPDSGITPYYWNGGILYLGFCEDSTNTIQGMTISFFDTLGNLNWKNVIFYPDYLSLSGSKILAFNNYSFYIAGSAYKDSIFHWDRFFSKFNANGHNIFLNIYSDTSNTGTVDMEPYSMDTILLLDELGDSGIHEKTIIYEVDTSGNIIRSDTTPWERKYPNQILKASNNKIYVGGTQRIDTFSTWSPNQYVDVYDLNLHRTSIWNPNTTWQEYFGGFCYWNNKLYVASREWWVDLMPIYGIGIGVLNDSGIYQNHQYLYKEQNNDIDVGNFYPQVLDSNYLVIAIQEHFININLFFVDSTLNARCTTRLIFPDSNYNEIDDMSLLPSKKLAGTGYWFATNTVFDQDHWNFLTEDLVDFIKDNCDIVSGVVENKKSQDPLYFVNPTLFNESVEIKYNGMEEPDFRISVYNNLGEEIMKSTGSRQSVLNTRAIKSGMYYLVIYDKDKSSVFKLVKAN